MSIKSQLINIIRAAPKGKIFVLSDFAHLGLYKSVQGQVNQLVSSGNLLQLATGIYKKPNFNQLINKEVPAYPGDIAKAYARKNNWKISPSGDWALNLLGLSTQVPNTYAYISSGPSKKFELPNGQLLTFRHVAPKESDMAPLSSMVVEALKALGRENISETTLRILGRKLNDKSYQRLKRDTNRASTWIRDIILNLEDHIHE